MENELAIIEAEVVQLGTINASSPQDVIVRASAIATELAKIIKNAKLFTNIQGKDFVRVEGWNTLGAMLGILPRERYVNMLDNGFEAYVELVRANDGQIIGGASAVCTRDENNWSNRPEYAVRSMAVTRATGKAFRLAFSWIMTLAGYEPTPAEEMDFGHTSNQTQQSKATPRPSKRETEKPGGPVGWLLDQDDKLNNFEAARIATLLQLDSKNKAEWKDRYTNYRTLRNEGKEPEEAAAMVLA